MGRVFATNKYATIPPVFIPPKYNREQITEGLGLSLRVKRSNPVNEQHCAYAQTIITPDCHAMHMHSAAIHNNAFADANNV